MVAELLRRHPSAAVVARGETAAREAATSQAIASGAQLILGARLPTDPLGMKTFVDSSANWPQSKHATQLRDDPNFQRRHTVSKVEKQASPRSRKEGFSRTSAASGEELGALPGPSTVMAR